MNPLKVRLGDIPSWKPGVHEAACNVPLLPGDTWAVNTCWGQKLSIMASCKWPVLLQAIPINLMHQARPRWNCFWISWFPIRSQEKYSSEAGSAHVGSRVGVQRRKSYWNFICECGQALLHLEGYQEKPRKNVREGDPYYYHKIPDRS